MKKKSHYFEIYINRVLKQVSDKNTFTLNAKQQLNSFICIFINRLASDINKLLKFVNKKICTPKEVAIIMNILVNGQLLKNCISEGEKAIQNYNSFDKSLKNVSKNNKAGIIFSPSIIEKMLKNNNIMISHVSCVSIYIAAICEYIVYEIIDLSVMNCGDKRSRITVKDMDYVVKNDVELYQLFNNMNTSFLVNFSSTEFVSDDKLILAKSSFSRLVRNYSKDAKITKCTLHTLQTYIEKYIIDILKNAYFLSKHASRIKLLPVDILLSQSIIKKLPSINPYIKNNNELLIM
jgi:histone H3/H4